LNLRAKFTQFNLFIFGISSYRFWRLYKKQNVKLCAYHVFFLINTRQFIIKFYVVIQQFQNIFYSLKYSLKNKWSAKSIKLQYIPVIIAHTLQTILFTRSSCASKHCSLVFLSIRKLHFRLGCPLNAALQNALFFLSFFSCTQTNTNTNKYFWRARFQKHKLVLNYLTFCKFALVFLILLKLLFKDWLICVKIYNDSHTL